MNIPDLPDLGDEGYLICSPVDQSLPYVIGAERFSSSSQGAVLVGPLSMQMPVISYTGWFEGQTWNEFLVETLAVMLGQLAKNLSMLDGSVKDQEVFVAGFHGLHFHVVKGYFTSDVITRIHSKGCSEDDVFELKFTRGYDLYLKNDWLEATRGLARLFRYLPSGDAKVGAIQAVLEGIQENGAASRH